MDDEGTVISIENENLHHNATSRDILINNALKDAKQEANAYSSTKSVGQANLDLALIASYIHIIVTLFSRNNVFYNDNSGFEIATLTLVCAAVLLQIIIFILVVLLYQTDGDQVTKNCSTVGVNHMVTILTGVSLIINIAITAVAGKLGAQALPVVGK